MVRGFDADDGWGVITSHDVPGDCFVDFSSIQADGFRALGAGQQVEFTYEESGSFLQDGYPFRAGAAAGQPVGMLQQDCSEVLGILSASRGCE